MDVYEVTDIALDAWRNYLNGHYVITRQMDHDLQSAHGMTLHDYDVLVQLRDAPKSAMRMSELARSVMLTKSGMTRLIDGLVRDGLVERRPCTSDARVSYAVITQHGLDRLAAARATHHLGIRSAFVDKFTDEELDQLAQLLGRLRRSNQTTEACCAQ